MVFLIYTIGLNLNTHNYNVLSNLNICSHSFIEKSSINEKSETLPFSFDVTNPAYVHVFNWD